MFLIPLNQIESVQLVVHALKMAGGEADCSSCPARRVCMKQCLTIAGTVEKMIASDTLPALREEGEEKPRAAEPPQPEPAEAEKAEERAGRSGHLKIIK